MIKIYTKKTNYWVLYGGEFEMIRKMSVGDEVRQTHIRFWNNTDYEQYINSIDLWFDSSDVFFNGSFYKIDTP